jgi:hypothetical protein
LPKLNITAEAQRAQRKTNKYITETNARNELKEKGGSFFTF